LNGALHGFRAGLFEALDGQLGLAGDDVERVVDFVRDAGGEEADAGEAFRFHELATLLRDHVFETSVKVFELGGHCIEIPSELDEFLAIAAVGGGGEISTGDGAKSFLQGAQGFHDVAVLACAEDEGCEDAEGEEEDGDAAGDAEAFAGHVLHQTDLVVAGQGDLIDVVGCRGEKGGKGRLGSGNFVVGKLEKRLQFLQFVDGVEG